MHLVDLHVQRIHMVTMLQSHPMMRKQMSWAIIFHRYLSKKQKTLYDTSKIINRQSSPNPVNYYFDTDNIRDKLTQLNIY